MNFGVKEGCKNGISCLGFHKEFHVKFQSAHKETKDLNMIIKSCRFYARICPFEDIFSDL